MLKAASVFLAGEDLVSSGVAGNVTLAGASRMTRHKPNIKDRKFILFLLFWRRTFKKSVDIDNRR